MKHVRKLFIVLFLMPTFLEIKLHAGIRRLANELCTAIPQEYSETFEKIIILTDEIDELATKKIVDSKHLSAKEKSAIDNKIKTLNTNIWKIIKSMKEEETNIMLSAIYKLNLFTMNRRPILVRLIIQEMENLNN